MNWKVLGISHPGDLGLVLDKRGLGVVVDVDDLGDTGSPRNGVHNGEVWTATD